MIQAEEKLEESKRLAEQAMFNVLSNDVNFSILILLIFLKLIEISNNFFII